MATNVTSLKFDDGETIVVRMWITTGGTSTFDITTTAIDFSNPNGVTFEWHPTGETTSRTFLPYSAIQQIFQEL